MQELGTCAYMLSDFPVAPTDYDRLAKLVLYAALSAESKALAEQVNRCRIDSLLTTAFTRNAVSMKYRGLFDLVSRKEQADGRNMLNYAAPMGKWTSQEGLEEWKRRHSRTRCPAAS